MLTEEGSSVKLGVAIRRSAAEGSWVFERESGGEQRRAALGRRVASCLRENGSHLIWYLRARHCYTAVAARSIHISIDRPISSGSRCARVAQGHALHCTTADNIYCNRSLSNTNNQ